MGWFDEQIRQRIRRDDEMLADVYAQMNNLVGTRKIERSFTDHRKPVEEAVGDIMEYYHVRRREAPEQAGTLQELLEYLLRPSGIMRRSVRLSGSWYKDAVSAMLGTKKDGSIIAILPGRTHGYYYKEYKTGTVVVINEKNASEINEDAICFYRPLPLRKMTAADLLRYMFRQMYPGDYAAILGMTVLCAILGMVTPAVSRYLYGEVLQYGNTALLAGAVLTLLCVTLSSCLFTAMKTILYTNMEIRMTLAMESATMMRILSLPVSFFKKYSSGELTDRIGYMNILCKITGNAVFSTGFTALFSLVYLGQIFAYTPALMIPAVLVLLCMSGMAVMTAVVQMHVYERKIEETGKESSIVYALFGGVTKIRNAGAEKRAFAKWGGQYVKTATCYYKPPAVLKWNKTILMAITLVGMAWIYYAAICSGITPANYMAFSSAYGLVSGAFTTLAGGASATAQIRPILKMLRPIFETAPEVEQSRQVVTKLRGAIELNNVSFRYGEDMPPVLDNLSLKIRPGQYVAVVGKTGCGKSTLMRLLLGFEKPQKGAIYYDGRDMLSMDLKSLRQKIGVVMQNGRLFQGDIYSNITISAPQLTLEQAWEAAKMAGLDEDIRRMPMGMHTLISEGKGGISGGQSQRLMIARALAPNPRILMLDEATSALDNITQKTVSESLCRLKCTRIVIAHRLSTIRQCDRILVLDKGKIVEDGTYEQLMEKKGYFSELVERQQVNAKD